MGEIYEGKTAENLEKQGGGPNNQKKKPLALIITAAVAIVVIGAIAAIAAFGGGNDNPADVIDKDTPFGKVINAYENTFLSAMQEYQDKFDSFSFEILVESDELMQELAGTSLSGAGIYGKLYVDSSQPLFGLEAGIEMESLNLLDASLIIGYEDIAVKSDAILGTKAYGIDLTTFAQNFETSIFGPEGEYSLGLTSAEIEELLSYIQTANSGMAQLEEKYEDVANESISVMLTSIEENAAFTETTEEYAFSSGSVNWEKIEIKIDKYAFAAIVEDEFRFVKETPEMQSCIYDLLLYSYSMEEDPAAMAQADFDNIMATIDDTLANIETLPEEIGDNEIIFTFYIEDEQMLGCYFDICENGENVFYAGYISDSASEDMTECHIELCDPTIEDIIILDYYVEENSDAKYAAHFLLSNESELINEVNIDYDKQSGEFVVSEENIDFALYGELSYIEDKTVIYLDRMAQGEEELSLATTLTFDPSAKITMPKYVDVLTLTTEEFEELISEVMVSVFMLMG